jgi:uncharacterized membrane protein YgcG
MHRTRRIHLVLALAATLALALTTASASAATATGTVSVRVEGLGATLLPPTQATTTTVPMFKDGNPEHSCPGTSALAGLNTATSGNWAGPWNEEFKQYEILTIGRETHLFEPGAEANYYWSYWLDEHESFIGACESEVQPGDRVLFFPACFGVACPPPQLPLGVEAPATADVGEALHVTVKRYGAGGEGVPEPGATVAGGASPVTTDAGGAATVTFAAAGTYTLSVSAPESVRTEATVCVHAAGDGGCGASTTSSGGTGGPGGSGSGGGSSSGSATAPYKGPFALVAKPGGLLDGHVYGRGSAPRLLAGTILAHTAVNSVELELRRSYRHRCSAYDGVRERFRRARCGTGTAFKVAAGGAFSYLLPAALGPGRYVLDVTATDVAGNRTTLARGTSRLVFYVR